MTGKFDPSSLASIEASLDSESTIVAVGDDDLRRIHGSEVRRKVAGLRLGARIVGMAMTERGELDDSGLLQSMQSTLDRMGALRKAVLAAIRTGRDDSDFSMVFNCATNIAIDLLVEEWKWSRLGQTIKPLAPEVLVQLLDSAAVEGPVFDEAESDAVDLGALRRLCIIESMPKLWTVTNIFHYYQPSREAMVARLARAVADRAEDQVLSLCGDTSPTFGQRAIIQRAYAASAGLMCEVYKQAAADDVRELRSMPELDRSVVLQQYEAIGMKYDHIITRHKAVMERAMDTTNLILEAQREQPRRNMEQGYAA